MTLEAISSSIDEADAFYYSAWVRGSHLEIPLKKILFAIRNKQGFMVCGDSGLGKSSLVEQVQRAIVSQMAEKQVGGVENASIPWLYIALENRSKPRDVMLDLLERLGLSEEDIPVRERTERKLRKLLFKQIRICEVRAIVFDEFQHLLRRGNASVNTSVADFIKVLMTSTKVSVGLVGMEEGAALLNLDKQIKTRWVQPFVLRPMSLNEYGEPEYFQWFLAELLKLYPRQTKDFSSRDNALRFLMITGGNLRELKNILTPLIRDTERCPEKVLTLKDVEKIYEIINHDVVFRGSNGRKVNPFGRDIGPIERYLRDASRF